MLKIALDRVSGLLGVSLHPHREAAPAVPGSVQEMLAVSLVHPPCQLKSTCGASIRQVAADPVVVAYLYVSVRDDS
eukprot:2041011-Rhodomonas_salina.4